MKVFNFNKAIKINSNKLLITDIDNSTSSINKDKNNYQISSSNKKNNQLNNSNTLNKYKNNNNINNIVIPNINNTTNTFCKPNLNKRKIHKLKFNKNIATDEINNSEFSKLRKQIANMLNSSKEDNSNKLNYNLKTSRANKFTKKLNLNNKYITGDLSKNFKVLSSSKSKFSNCLFSTNCKTDKDSEYLSTKENVNSNNKFINTTSLTNINKKLLSNSNVKDKNSTHNILLSKSSIKNAAVNNSVLNSVKYNKTNNSDINNEHRINNKKLRVRTFKVFYISNYNNKKQNNLILPKSLYQNIEFQCSYISDQIKVLNESIENVRFNLFSNTKEVIEAFTGISNKNQQEINLIIEETCGLILEISYSILSDFSNYIEKFITVLPPSKERLKLCYVKNEENTFFINSKLFVEISLFLKACYEVYLVLLKQEDDISLSYQKFVEVSQYLARSRYNISVLNFRTKNFVNNYNKDKEKLNKFLASTNYNSNNYNNNANCYFFSNSIINNKELKINLSNIHNTLNNNNNNNTAFDVENNTLRSSVINVISKPYLICKKPKLFKDIVNKKPVIIEKVKKSKFNSVKHYTNTGYSKKALNERDYYDLSEKIRNQFIFKRNENYQKIKKLNKILSNKDYDFNNTDVIDIIQKNKTNKVDKGCLNSTLINSLMKFIPKELQHQIISQRIIERFKDKNYLSEDVNY